MSDYIYNPDTGELYHYGVKGMKWGVRKKREESADVARARSAMKSAKSARTDAKINKRIAQGKHNDAYNRAYNYSSTHQVSQWVGKNKKMSDKLWEESHNAARESNKADAAYKKAKKDYRQAKRDYKDAKTADKYNRHGLDANNIDHVVDVYNYGYKGAQRIQNRMKNKNMSHLKASSIEAGKIAAATLVTTVGTAAVATYMAAPNQVLDATGKVIKRFY